MSLAVFLFPCPGKHCVIRTYFENEATFYSSWFCLFLGTPAARNKILTTLFKFIRTKYLTYRILVLKLDSCKFNVKSSAFHHT